MHIFWYYLCNVIVRKLIVYANNRSYLYTQNYRKFAVIIFSTYKLFAMQISYTLFKLNTKHYQSLSIVIKKKDCFTFNREAIKPR